MQIRVRCEACGGTGRNDAHRDDSCPECQGEGTLALPEPSLTEALARLEAAEIHQEQELRGLAEGLRASLDQLERVLR